MSAFFSQLSHVAGRWPLLLLSFTLLLPGLLAGCAEEEVAEDAPVVDPANEWDLGLPLGSSESALTSGGKGQPGLPRTVAGADTEVWAIRHDWTDTSSTEARRAGLAWPANSGLDWEEKYSLWAAQLERTAAEAGGDTFLVTNPQGKTLPIPYLECSELTLMLRSVFASWYGLPFWVEAKDASGTRIYLGHFGFRTSAGRYRSTPRFRTSFNDYSHLSAADAIASWPKDNTLRTKHFYNATDDNNPFLSATAGPGQYFDELLLNKRVGWFLLILLDYFGSMNLADEANAYHVKAESLRAGDMLVERWQQRGIGHVFLVKNVTPQPMGRMRVELASGSMPRRQARWENGASSRMALTSEYGGGEGTNSEGLTYASLGGGVKRFLQPEISNGNWRMSVRSKDLSNYLTFANATARAARPAQFAQLLAEESPERMRDDLLAIIEQKRAHLREHPSSCSARTAREDAFEQLYSLLQSSFNLQREQVDALYRDAEDYVFAELVYPESRTCCWNSTTAQMYEIIMDLHEERQEQSQSCVQPEVFKAVDGDYAVFRAHAQATGRGTQWLAWQADETCPQAQPGRSDIEAAHGWTPWCEIEDDLSNDAGGSSSLAADNHEANNTQQTATQIGAGAHTGLSIHTDDVDWFRFSPPNGATVRVTITFAHAVGDLDLALFRDHTEVDSSAGTGSNESVDTVFTGEGVIYAKVLGYGGDAAPYTMDVVFEGGLDLGDPCATNNETLSTAVELPAGVYSGLRICSGDVDWYRVPASAGSGPISVVLGAGAGNLDLEVYNSSAALLGSSVTNNSTETVQTQAGVRYVKVFGRSGATGEYSLRVAR